MKLFFKILILSLMFSCEETIVLDTEQVDPKLVIQSHLTNEYKRHVVVLRLSVDFYFQDMPPVIEDAEVTIRDITQGIDYPFTITQSSNPEFENYYLSDQPFEGVIGNTYELKVIWNEEEYVATETMLHVASINSLSYRINPFEYQDQSKVGYYYEVLLNATEPQETEDYYLFKFYRNDSLIFASENDIYFTDDGFLGEEIRDLPGPVFYSKGDNARVEMFSISRQAYIYFSDLLNNLNNDSGMFSPPPANPRNNISNGALGYFIVSGVEKASVVIE